MAFQEKLERVRNLIERLIRLEDVKFRISGSPKILMDISRGLDKLPVLFGAPQVDDESVVDFLVYQIYRNRRSIAEGSFNLSWIFSDNAVSRYRNQFLVAGGKSGMNYYINQWLDEYEYTRAKLVAMIADPKPNPLRSMVYMPSEEPIKRRFFNTQEGFALCQVYTTGWSPFSETCKECKNATDCKITTNKNYPELYRFRVDEYGKKQERK